MNAGKPIRELEEVASVAAGSSYIVESGNGAGTKRITHENLVKAVGDDLPLGIMEDLQTDDKNNLVGAVNEVLKKTGETFKGADEIRPGNKGAVPAPQVEDREKFLRGDGTWAPVQGTGSGVDAETLEGHNAEYFQAAEDQMLNTSNKTVVGAINQLQEKTGDILDSKEEIEANTTEDMIAGALPVKELYKNLGGVVISAEGSGEDVKYFAQLGADAASKKQLGEPSITMTFSGGITRGQYDAKYLSGAPYISAPEGWYVAEAEVCGQESSQMNGYAVYLHAGMLTSASIPAQNVGYKMLLDGLVPGRRATNTDMQYNTATIFSKGIANGTDTGQYIASVLQSVKVTLKRK